MSAPSSVDPDEVRRFDALAAQWWDPAGGMAALHRINPARLGYLAQTLARQFGRPGGDLAGLSILDLGCGAGLIAEPLARLGAAVTGADAAADAIEVARRHAARGDLAIDYRCATAEALAAEGAGFDAVLALEIVEHVTDPAAFLATAASLVRPGGLVVVSTLNRTLKAYALAIVGAERILRWLPRGTHRWDRFLRPEEVEASLRRAGLKPLDRRGLVYDPLRDVWRLSERDLDVNYFVAMRRPAP